MLPPGRTPPSFFPRKRVQHRPQAAEVIARLRRRLDAAADIVYRARASQCLQMSLARHREQRRRRHGKGLGDGERTEHPSKIGRATVYTPVTNAQLVFRLLLTK